MRTRGSQDMGCCLVGDGTRPTREGYKDPLCDELHESTLTSG